MFSGVSSMAERRFGSQVRAVGNIASSLLGSLADGLSKKRSNVPVSARVYNMPEVGSSTPPPLTSPVQWARNSLRSHGSSLRAGNPFHFPKLVWNQPLGLPECPYMRRWALDFGAFALRVHRWQSSDDSRAYHDHPWWFLTCVLWGSYTDVSEQGEDTLTPGSIRFRNSSHKHTVKILKPGTWTLLITGPAVRRWGFWVKGKLWKRDRYFAVMGHHPCSPVGEPVRLRPDGSKIK